MNQFDRKIKAIKAVRERTGMGLLDAKNLVDEIEPLLQSDAATDKLNAEVAELQDKLIQARHDLFGAIRLVDYFVAHPVEWSVWVAGKGGGNAEAIKEAAG